MEIKEGDSLKYKILNTTEDLKNYNIRKILEVIRDKQVCSKRTISAQCGLSFATVSSLCNLLIQAEILTTSYSESSSGGRIPETLSLNRNIWILSVNMINSYQIRLTISNFFQETMDLGSIVLQKNDIPEEKAAQIYDLVSQKAKDCSLIGISVAFAGIYSPKNQLFANITNPLIDYHPFKKAMESLFSVPVCYDNESNLMALALARKNPDKDNLIFLHLGEGVGTGLGLGVISDRKVLLGSHGFASEVGHIPLGTRDFSCYCGHSGCLESELTMKGFVRKYCEDIGDDEEEISKKWEEFTIGVISGEKKATEVLQENGKLIGLLLSILSNIFDPSAVYIGGFIGRLFPYLFPYIMDEMTGRLTIKGYFSIPVFYCDNSDGLIIEGGVETVFRAWQPCLMGSRANDLSRERSEE